MPGSCGVWVRAFTKGCSPVMAGFDAQGSWCNQRPLLIELRARRGKLAVQHTQNNGPSTNTTNNGLWPSNYVYNARRSRKSFKILLIGRPLHHRRRNGKITRNISPRTELSRDGHVLPIGTSSYIARSFLMK